MGSREGDWLRLSDELGYMRIVDHDGTQLLVQQAPSWQVAYHEVAIRSSNDTASKELGFKSKGTTVRGSREGDWLRLSDKLGYMRIVDRDGTQLLVQQAPSLQVAYHEVAIRSSNDTASKELGFKSTGTTVRGSR